MRGGLLGKLLAALAVLWLAAWVVREVSLMVAPVLPVLAVMVGLWALVVVLTWLRRWRSR